MNDTQAVSTAPAPSGETPLPMADTAPRRGSAWIHGAAWVSLYVILFVLIVGSAYGIRWWRQKEKEAVVSHWLMEAKTDIARGNLEESRRTLEWLRKYHSDSLQMDKAFFMLGRLYMDYYGDLEGARFYFTTQMNEHWFSELTFASWQRLKEIDRLRDRGEPYELAVWKEFSTAKRRADAGDRAEALARMQVLVDSYPKSVVAPEILYTMANISLKDRGLTSDARKYFGMLRARYPGSHLVEKIPPDDVLRKPDMPLEFRDGERS